MPESSCIPKDSTCSFHNGQTKLIRFEESKNNPRVIIRHLKKELVVRGLEIGDRARDGSKKVNSEAACRIICVKDSVFLPS